MARGPLLVVALLLALGFSTCHRDLLSAFTVEWPEEVGRGPRGPDPWDPPSGGSNQAVQGNTVSSVLTPNPTVCMNYCKTVAGAKYYNYCNHPTNCGGIEIGGCACKSFEGQPQFVADPSGFISGPVDSSGATSTSENLFPATFSSARPENLAGAVVSTSNVGAGNADACKDKCASTSECQGYNFCDASGGCGSYPAGTCDLKKWDGAPTHFPDSTSTIGDGWLSGIKGRTS